MQNPTRCPQQNIPSDQTFVNSIASYIRRCASSYLDNAHMYIETAGGKNLLMTVSYTPATLLLLFLCGIV